MRNIRGWHKGDAPGKADALKGPLRADQTVRPAPSPRLPHQPSSRWGGREAPRPHPQFPKNNRWTPTDVCTATLGRIPHFLLLLGRFCQCVLEKHVTSINTHDFTVII